MLRGCESPVFLEACPICLKHVDTVVLAFAATCSILTTFELQSDLLTVLFNSMVCDTLPLS